MVGERKGIILDRRRGCSSKGEDATGDRGGISITEALICCTSLNEDSVGVMTGTVRVIGERESFTGDNGRGIVIAVGGAFLVFIAGSIFTRFDIGRFATAVEDLKAEYRRTDELGTLKLGVTAGP